MRKKKLTKNLSAANRSKSIEIQHFPIVAIGASAGGLAAFEEFLKSIPANSNMAYICITHLDRTHVSMLPEIMQKFTKMPVIPIINNIEIEPNKVYVITPKSNVSLGENKLVLSDQIEPHFENKPIDWFLHSLAREKTENAVGVILSGSGTDGVLGAREIKKNHGVVFVQDPKEAEYTGMPLAVIDSGMFDYIAPAAKIYNQIQNWHKHISLSEVRVSPEIKQIFSLLQYHTGHDFSSYKLNTIYRRIEKQLRTNHLSNISDYLRLLRLHPQLVENLFHDLLIGVTSFFRDPEAFDELKNQMIERIFKIKPRNHLIRIWVPGCSTGEEVYSVAIIVKECMEKMKRHFPVQIFGTDIDTKALEVARLAIYPATITTDVSPKRLKQYFTKEVGDSYKVKKEIREMVIFGAQNIIKDPPFIKLDLLCCRNLLIYLNSYIQKKLLPLFHYSLNSKGLLFLGISEATAGYNNLFNLIAKKSKIFERKDTSSTSLSFASDWSRYDLLNVEEGQGEFIGQNTVIDSVKHFLSSFDIKPTAVVNSKGDIIYIHGKFPKDVFLSSRTKQSNLIKAIPAKLRPALISGIRKASVQKKGVEFNDIVINTRNKKIYLNMRIKAITGIPSWQDNFTVSIEEIIFFAKSKKDSKSLPPNNRKIIELEEELQYTRGSLQTVIEELETSNEELQSANEELQSTNEEIETSKEELQSLNEELVMVNSELQARIDQLAIINDDMNNLFNSIEIAAFFLDNDLCIKRFTPKARDFIHLLPTDIGRSISHFATELKHCDLAGHAQKVLSTLNHAVFEVQNQDGRWYTVRILPYRTITNVIEGVVITFSDITIQKTAERKLMDLNNELSNALNYSENIFDTVREGLLVLDHSLKIKTANRSFLKLFKFEAQEIVDNEFCKILSMVNDKDGETLKKLLNDVMQSNKSFEGFELTFSDKDHINKKMYLNARRILPKDKKNPLLLLAIDVNEK